MRVSQASVAPTSPALDALHQPSPEPSWNGGGDDLELAERLGAVVLSSPLLRRLSSEVLRYVARASALDRVSTGGLIAGDEDAVRPLMVVLRGHASVALPGRRRHRTLETLGPGQFCGAEAQGGAPVITEIVAETEVELLQIPPALSRILCARDPAIAEMLRQRAVRSACHALLGVAPFRCDPARTARLLMDRGASFVTVPAGHCIITERAVSDAVFLLASGAVDVAVPDPLSGFEDVRRDSPGTLLGKSSVMGIAETAATWTAERSELLRIPRRSLSKLLDAGEVSVDLPQPTRDAA